MAGVVLVGAAVGGLPVPQEARESMAKNHKVTVIPNAFSYFAPSNPWMAIG